MADMADAAMSGPMQTPEPTMEDFAVVEQIRQEVPASEINETLLATAAEADPMAVAEFKSELRDLELPIEVLDVLNDMVDEILASPDRYDEIRAHYKTQEMPDDLLPETFDPEFFGALNMALDEIRATSGAQARAPQRFAMGGIASLGRNGDTMLAHVTPAEMKMLKDKGGAGTINPRTGLPEFFSLSKIFKKIGKAVKKFARSTVGKIVIGTALFMIAGPAAAQALGVSSAAGTAAVSGFVAGAGSSLAAGNSLKDSLKAGAIGGLAAGAFTGVTQGADAFKAAKAAPVSESTGVTVSDVAVSPQKLDLSEIIDTTSTAASPITPSTTPGFSVGNMTASAPVSMPPPPAQAGFTAGGVQSSMPAPPMPPSIADAGVGGLDTGGLGGQTIVDAPAKAPGFFESVKETFAPDRTLAERGTSLKEAFLPGKGASLQEVLDANPGMGPTEAQLLVESAATDLGRQYLPLAGAGLGVMALSGGFDTPQPEVPAGFEDFMAGGGQRLLEENPEKYGLRFGGIQPLSSLYTNYAPPTPTYNAAKGSGPKGVAPDNFPRMNGPINGPGTGTSDDVPAMLSDGEFVFTAKAVRNMGDGSRRKGAKRMYAMMKKLENRANG